MSYKAILIAILLTITMPLNVYVNSSDFKPEPTSDWDIFIEAIIWKESMNNDSAIGDSGKAVGCLQMWPIMVSEANRVGHTTFTNDDRYSRDKSIAMFNAVQDHYNPKHDFDKALKIWNPKHPQSYKDDIMNKYNELRRAI